MDDEEALIFLSFILLKRRCSQRETKTKDGKKRSIWVRKIYKHREECGIYHTLVQEMALGDRDSFFRFMRMSPDSFKYLLNVVRPEISKKDTRFRKAISPSEKIAKDFYEIWNLPHCIGAIDGKHVRMKASINSIIIIKAFSASC